ncbi:hypothetical protein ACF1BU_03135 [Streptomyces sp. NPDC014724]
MNSRWRGVWGVLQVFAVVWPTRSVRLSTVLPALAVPGSPRRPP